MGNALCICSRGTITINNKRYLLIHRLGEGGFSYVDLVEGLQDGRFYALKRIICHDKDDRQEALHEVEMHLLFEHPNILPLCAHAMVEKGSKHEAWLLLPFLKRGTLWQEVEALRDKGCFMPEERILVIFHGICRGLQAIHNKGHAHRDLKPTNVLLDNEDQPLLMDLGSMNQARIEVRSSQEAMTIQACRDLQLTIDTLQDHGFVLNFPKSHLHPTTSLLHLGMVSNLETCVVSPSQERQQSLQSLVSQVLNQRSCLNF
ncbi:serine/threonine-protein kinase 16 isoform X3 [Thamnophis elegans]|uniref:serine/threonine-protein kinase 16 isoform X3 n=1 Tax=Thamnophis elegans TaxID=35005 RepID=UPI001376F4E8|nr:serine/threonine-protein kinase 16 isoform X3 [Thamnophis elegans]